MFELALTPLIALVAFTAAVPGLVIVVVMTIVWFLHVYYENDDTSTGARFDPVSRTNGLVVSLKDYFRIHVPAAGPPQVPHIYLLHPHGILAASSLGILGMKDGPLLAIHSWFFLVPLLRAWMLKHGAIDTRESTLRARLCQGQSIAIYPDGTRAMGTPYLPGRKRPFVHGIVRIAYELDIPIVPVYCGGEKDLCWHWNSEWGWVTFLRRSIYSLAGYPLPTLFWPRWLTSGSRPPPLTLRFGSSIAPKDYATCEALQDAYMTSRFKLAAVY